MASDYFRITTEQAAHVVELSIPAHIDSGEFDRINEALLQAFSREPEGAWVVDLSQLAYMGSSVLGLFVNVRQRVKDGGGRLVLCGMSARLTRVFQTCSLERLFVIRADRADAMRSVK